MSIDIPNCVTFCRSQTNSRLPYLGFSFDFVTTGRNTGVNLATGTILMVTISKIRVVVILGLINMGRQIIPKRWGLQNRSGLNSEVVVVGFHCTCTFENMYYRRPSHQYPNKMTLLILLSNYRFFIKLFYLNVGLISWMNPCSETRGNKTGYTYWHKVLTFR